jgi:hypothetical protein
MSCTASSWRLYPERSITPHSICGSERLFPGLESETRKADMTALLVGEQQTRTRASLFHSYPDVKTILADD